MKNITVLMAVYNTPPAMAEQAIDSILAQTCQDFEFLVIDDGSRSEATRQCLRQRAARDSRMRLCWESHRGLTATLNLGLRQAEGVFVARQDADDWSEPTRLAKQVEYLEAHPEIGLCGSNVWIHQQDGTPLWRTRLPRRPDEILEALWHGNPFIHGAAMFRRDPALALGGYREAFRCAQDYDFFWRMTEACGAANLPESLYHYRYALGSVSAMRAIEQVRVYYATRCLAEARRKGQAEDLDAALHSDSAWEAARTGSLQAALKQADHLLLAGAYRAAWRAYGDLVQAHPWSPLGWGKLARWAVFQALPRARAACFR